MARPSLRSAVFVLLAIGLIAAAFFALRRELAGLDYKEVVAQLRAIPRKSVLLSFGLMVCSYVLLTGYDFLAMLHVQRKLPAWRVALASFLSYVFSHNVGLAGVGGTAVRFRLYSTWGLSTFEIVRICAFCGLTLWLGVLAVAGAHFVAQPVALEALASLPAPFDTTRPWGIVFLAMLLAVLGLPLVRRRPFLVRGYQVPLPSPGMLLSQTLLASLDWALAAAVLYVLMPPSVPFVEFIGIYTACFVVAMISHVPGGVGIFDATLLLLLPDDVNEASVVGALLLFRGIYYLLPLGAATLLLGGYEAGHRKRELTSWARSLQPWFADFIPDVLTVAVVIGGALLVFSCAMPFDAGRMQALLGYVPLAVVEAAAVMLGVVGGALVLAAHGLHRRLDRAFGVAVGLLMAGITLLLLRGLAWEEGLVLLLLLLALLPCRRAFTRRGTLLAQGLPLGWTVAFVLVLLAAGWLAGFAHQRQTVSLDDVLAVAPGAEWPRAVRGLLAAVVVFVGGLLLRLVRAGPPRLELPGRAALGEVAAFLARRPEARGALGLVGDKALLWSEGRDALLIYAVRGRSWVALGDPVGPVTAWEELLWRFHDLVDRHGGRPVFHQVGGEELSLYLEHGLSAVKIGEHARLPLAGFSLMDERHAALRQAVAELDEGGARFTVLSPGELSRRLAELRAVSDDWLAGADARERGFSVGRFRESLLQHCTLALLEQEGRVLAFAAACGGGPGGALSLELLRARSGVPPATPQALVGWLSAWAAMQGRSSLELGLVPPALPGPASETGERVMLPVLAAWGRAAQIVRSDLLSIDDFVWPRAAVEPLGPEFRDRFLVCGGGALALRSVLTDVAALVSRKDERPGVAR